MLRLPRADPQGTRPTPRHLRSVSWPPRARRRPDESRHAPRRDTHRTGCQGRRRQPGGQAEESAPTGRRHPLIRLRKLVMSHVWCPPVRSNRPCPRVRGPQPNGWEKLQTTRWRRVVPGARTGTRLRRRSGHDGVDVDLEVDRAAQDRARPVGRRIDDEARVLEAAGDRGRARADPPAAPAVRRSSSGCRRRSRSAGCRAGRDRTRPGRTNSSGSRLAAASSRTMRDPFGIVVPAMSMSAAATRLGRYCTGGSNRRSSSTKRSEISGSRPQPLEEVRVAQHRQRAVGDEVDGRLVPRDEHQPARGDQIEVLHRSVEVSLASRDSRLSAGFARCRPMSSNR